MAKYTWTEEWLKLRKGAGMSEGPREAEQEEKHRRLNIPPCCISHQIELDYDALENCNNVMEMYIDIL